MHSIALDCIIFDKILDPPHVAHSSKIGAYMSLLEAEFQRLVCLKGYPDNCPPRKIAPRLGLGFRSKLGLVLGLKGGGGATRQLLRRKIGPWLGSGFGLGLFLRLGGNISWGQLS